MSYLKSLMEYETDIVGNHFLVDPFKVFDVLNNIVSLIKVQMMRDRYTTPECNYETLTRMISLKLEDDRSLEVYFNELLDLLKKPGTDGPVIKMMISRM